MFNRLQYASPWIKTAQILPQICMQKQITNNPSDIKVLDEAWDILQYMGKVRAIINTTPGHRIQDGNKLFVMSITNKILHRGWQLHNTQVTQFQTMCITL